MSLVYVKYNRSRLHKYQIVTTISKSGECLHVEKRALRKEALEHIYGLERNYYLLKENLQNVEIAPVTLMDERAIFPFIEGTSYEALLLDAVMRRDEDGFFSIIDDYRGFLNGLGVVNKKIFIPGVSADKMYYCLNITNPDITFENVIVKGSEKWIIDYEWVFDWVVPNDYLIYRSISLFYWKYSSYIKDFVSFTRVINHLGYSDDETNLFDLIENRFQEMVNGSPSERLNLEKYKKKAKTLAALESEVYEERNKRNELLDQLNEVRVKLRESENRCSEYRSRLILSEKNNERLSKLLDEKERFLDSSHYPEEVERYRIQIEHLNQELLRKEERIRAIEELLDIQQTQMAAYFKKNEEFEHLAKHIIGKRGINYLMALLGKGKEFSLLHILQLEIEKKNTALEFVTAQIKHLEEELARLNDEVCRCTGELMRAENELMQVNRELKAKIRKVSWLESELQAEKEENSWLSERLIQIESEAEMLRCEKEETQIKHKEENEALKKELGRIMHLHHIKDFQLKELKEEFERLRRKND
jgi:hypothetical protein